MAVVGVEAHIVDLQVEVRRHVHFSGAHKAVEISRS